VFVAPIFDSSVPYPECTEVTTFGKYTGVRGTKNTPGLWITIEDSIKEANGEIWMDTQYVDNGMPMTVNLQTMFHKNDPCPPPDNKKVVWMYENGDMYFGRWQTNQEGQALEDDTQAFYWNESPNGKRGMIHAGKWQNGNVRGPGFSRWSTQCIIWQFPPSHPNPQLLPSDDYRLAFCPNQHEATLSKSVNSKFVCDLCNTRIPSGCEKHSCHECGWDACKYCSYPPLIEGQLYIYRGNYGPTGKTDKYAICTLENGETRGGRWEAGEPVEWENHDCLETPTELANLVPLRKPSMKKKTPPSTPETIENSSDDDDDDDGSSNYSEPDNLSDSDEEWNPSTKTAEMMKSVKKSAVNRKAKPQQAAGKRKTAHGMAANRPVCKATRRIAPSPTANVTIPTAAATPLPQYADAEDDSDEDELEIQRLRNQMKQRNEESSRQQLTEPTELFRNTNDDESSRNTVRETRKEKDVSHSSLRCDASAAVDPSVTALRIGTASCTHSPATTAYAERGAFETRLPPLATATGCEIAVTSQREKATGTGVTRVVTTTNIFAPSTEHREGATAGGGRNSTQSPESTTLNGVTRQISKENANTAATPDMASPVRPRRQPATVATTVAAAVAATVIPAAATTDSSGSRLTRTESIRRIRDWLLELFPVGHTEHGCILMQEYAQQLEEMFLSLECLQEEIKDGQLQMDDINFMKHHAKRFLRLAKQKLEMEDTA
jgi:hypothetical protein